MQRVSLSFLVDTMDKRRGGCAPNIAYTLALLGERPRLMATAGQDFGDYRRWLEAAGVDTSLVKRGRRTSSPRRSSAAPTPTSNQIASFYTGAMANAAELSFRTATGCRPGDHLAERSGGDGAVRRGVPHARHPVHLGSGPAVRAHVGRRAPRRLASAPPRHLQRLRVRADPAEDRAGRSRHPGAYRALVVTRGEHGCSIHESSGRVDVAAVPPHRIVDPDRRRRRVPRRIPEGHGARRELSDLCAGSAAWPRPTRSSTSAARATPTPGRSSPPATKAHFGEAPPLT